LLHEHFGEPVPEAPCGACDVCVDADTWLAERLSPRPLKAPAPKPEPDDPPAGQPAAADAEAPPFERGDWVRVGRHYGQVVRVDRRGNRWELLVESASDFKRRKVDPRRQQVERLENGG
ncbi:MAG: RecQ family zinc-binding domain-containing protein, partial [Planctomycetota bacterium]